MHLLLPQTCLMDHMSEEDSKTTNWISTPPQVFLGKYVLKICSKFTEKHPCRSAISIKLLWNFIGIAFRHWCVNLLHTFRTTFIRTPMQSCFSNWLSVDQREQQRLNVIVFKYANYVCSYKMWDVFEHAPQFKISSRNSFTGLNFFFDKLTWYRKFFHIFVPLSMK